MYMCVCVCVCVYVCVCVCVCVQNGTFWYKETYNQFLPLLIFRFIEPTKDSFKK